MKEKNSKFYNRVFKDPENGHIAGVCQGIANHFSFSPKGVRVIWCICLVFFFPLALLSYFVLAICLENKRNDENDHSKNGCTANHETSQTDMSVTGLKNTIQKLERKIQRLEDEVMKRELEKDRVYKGQ